MHFVIDRQYWLRGKGSSSSALYRPDLIDHNMCCLGQIGEQCGIPKNSLTYCETPGQLHEDNSDLFAQQFMGLPSYSGIDDRAKISDLMQINDDKHIDDDYREMMLTDLIAYWFGHTLEFIN